MAHEDGQFVGDEWVSFPGGELEGKRPKTLCPACRTALAREASARLRGAGSTRRLPRPSSPSRPLCFQCYRAGLDRERALRDAGQLNTTSDERFQFQLPFEPVDRPRLAMLKVERADARAIAARGGRERGTARVIEARFADKRRHAQIEARHALQVMAAGLKSRQLPATDRDREMMLAIHAAELQLPEAWTPFVVAR